MASKEFPPIQVELAESHTPTTEHVDYVEPEEDWGSQEEKKLVKKIDFRILPMLCVVFGLSLLDRANISAAYIAGMGKDLELVTGNRYSIALLIFFPTYLLCELPSNLVIRRIGGRLWLSFLITTWGCVILGSGFTRHWTSLAILRLFLGVFEAGLFPGAVYIISSWYRQYEIARRVSIFYMSALLSSGFGGILAYGLSLIRVGDGLYRQGWRWIFIFEGLITVVVGVISFFTLGEFPEKTRWLDERQKYIAKTRVGLGRTDNETQVTLQQSMKFLLDWKLLVYSLQYFVAAAGGYSLVFFLPIILREEMGFSYALSQIMNGIPYLFAIAASLGMAWVSDHYRTRWPILCSQSTIGVVGLLIILYAKPPGIRYFGSFLAVFGTQANIPATLGYAQNQTARPAKKGIVSAAMISFGAAGGIAGSTIFRAQDAPLYLPGMWATISMQLVYTLAVFAMSMYLKRQNRLADEGKLTMLEGVEGFRYAP